MNIDNLQIIKRNSRSVIFQIDDQLYGANQHGVITPVKPDDHNKIDCPRWFNLAYGDQPEILNKIGYCTKYKSGEAAYYYSFEAITDHYKSLLEYYPDRQYYQERYHWAMSQLTAA